ncbi:hypothetical protein FF38_12668 [Lucilia cuprina]|uniref:Uncharacterized protein n=1 Tax=Lucilia cuprina TaxID=7375 RepID=A0A0L0C6T5_LUCCU|nr:hypothetical protein FF38_12668 [Lucilia cuprina]
MKLFLYPALIWGLVQLFAVNPSKASTFPIQTISAKEQLLQYYDKELQLLGKMFSEKAKNFSEQLLKFQLIKEASTPTIREFKENITDFLDDYSIYRRYNLNMQLLMQFALITQPFYDLKSNPNKDSQDIIAILEKLKYEDLLDEYEVKFQELIKQKYLPKFEELKTQLLTSNSNQSTNLLNWYDGIKKCQDYVCSKQQLNDLYDMLSTPQDDLLDYIYENIDHLYINYITKANKLAKSILRESKLSYLSTQIRQQLINNIKNFIKNYKSSHDIEQIYTIILDFYNNILLKFYYNKDLPTKDRQLLVNIFDENDIAEFDLKFQLKFNNFINTGLLKHLKEFKTVLSQEELEREQPLLRWFDHLMGLTNYADRVIEFANPILYTSVETKHYQSEFITELSKPTLNDEKPRFKRSLTSHQLCTELSNELENLFTQYLFRAIDIVVAARKVPEFSHLRLELKDHLSDNIYDFIFAYNSYKEKTELSDLIILFYNNIIRYIHNTNISIRSRILLAKIFKTQSLANFQLDYKRKFNNFAEDEVRKRFESFKTLATQEELAEMQFLSKWVDKYKTLEIFPEKVRALGELYEKLLYISIVKDNFEK